VVSRPGKADGKIHLTKIYHLQFSIKQEKFAYIKEGLAAYRNITQSANISSLETVLKKYLEQVEQLFTASIKNIPNPNSYLKEIEEDDNPEERYVSIIKMDDMKEDVTKKWKLMVEAYKVELDLIYKNKNLEEMYCQVAKKAFQKCRKHNMKGDFKKLCEIVKGHQYQNVKTFEKSGNGGSQIFALNIKQAETNERLMDLRMIQLGIAEELSLWQDSYKIIEDINILLRNRKKTSNDLLLKYYQHLYKVFWSSNHYLLHAVSLHSYFACLRKKTDEPDQTAFVNNLVLAAISIPMGQLEECNNSEMFRKNCSLINSAGQIMNRQQLIANLKNGPYLDLCSEEVRTIFFLMTECKDILMFSKKIDTVMKWLEKQANCVQYIELIEQNIIASLMEKLSTLYKGLSFATFKKLVGFLDFAKCEKYLLYSQNSGGVVKAQIDYGKKMFTFGNQEDLAEKVNASLVNFTNEISTTIKHVTRLKEKDNGDAAKTEKQCIVNARNLVEDADEEIRRKREEFKSQNNRSAMNAQREDIAKIKNLEEEEHRMMRRKEKQLQDNDQQKLKIMMDRVRGILKMDKNATCKGKRLEVFTESDYLKLELDTCIEIEDNIRVKQARAEEEKMEKQFKIKDYFERELMKERYELLRKEKAGKVTNVEEIKQRAKESHERNLEAKKALLSVKDFVNRFKDNANKVKLEKFNEDVKDYKEKLTAEFTKQIVEQAKKRKHEDDEKKKREKEEAENRKAEETRKQLAFASNRPKVEEVKTTVLSRNDKNSKELQETTKTTGGLSESSGLFNNSAKKPSQPGVLVRGQTKRGEEAPKEEEGSKPIGLTNSKLAPGKSLKSDLAQDLAQSSQTIGRGFNAPATTELGKGKIGSLAPPKLSAQVEKPAENAPAKAPERTGRTFK
jgi:translation initiation factor 3 subunit A